MSFDINKPKITTVKLDGGELFCRSLSVSEMKTFQVYSKEHEDNPFEIFAYVASRSICDKEGKLLYEPEEQFDGVPWQRLRQIFEAVVNDTAKKN
jgi:hypothetical protein